MGVPTSASTQKDHIVVCADLDMNSKQTQRRVEMQMNVRLTMVDAHRTVPTLKDLSPVPVIKDLFSCRIKRPAKVWYPHLMLNLAFTTNLSISNICYQ